MKKIQTKQVYLLTIKPALKPEERFKIEKSLEKLKYEILGGGTYTDMSACEIAFQKK